jgi:hypothetical protein
MRSSIVSFIGVRAIRAGVPWHKGNLGTQRAERSHFVEAIMTVEAPLKQQHRNVFTDFTTACEAALCGQRVPSFLPTSENLQQVMHPAV